MAPVTAAVMVFSLGACAPFREAPPHAPPPPPDVEAPVPDGPPPSPARTVYIIEGDGDYLYHDARGNRRRADEEAVREAREAAGAALQGEVFVFHRRTGFMRKLWGSRSGLFEHYRFGRLVSATRYVRHTPGLNDEAVLLHHLPEVGARDSASNAPPPLTLAYFGHEILMGEGKAGRLTLTEFAHGLEGFAEALGGGRDKPYAVIVLSTCYGGTPATMRALTPLAEFAVASPAYLHLSYLEAGSLATFSWRVPEEVRRREARQLADSVAGASFNRLRQQTSTEITVAVYDLREVVPPRLASVPVTRAENTQRPRHAALLWDDCTRAHAALRSEEIDRGVTLRYQPPRFGMHQETLTRSAWQCPL